MAFFINRIQSLVPSIVYAYHSPPIFIRLWDIEEIYTGKRGSMNASMHGSGGMGGGSMHGGSIQGSVHGGVGASTHGISPNKGIGT